jgi:hypothetical protein
VTGGSTSICTGDLAQAAFQFAVCACDGVNPFPDQASLTTDAFDSAAGLYGAAGVLDGGINKTNDGHVAANGPIDWTANLDVGGSLRSGTSIALDSNNHVRVDVYSAGTLDTDGATVERDAYVVGTIVDSDIARDLYVTNISNVGVDVDIGSPPAIVGPIPALDPCPCEADQIIDVAALTGYGATQNDNEFFDGGFDPNAYATAANTTPIDLPCGRWYLTAINQPGNAVSINAQGRTVLFIDGDLVANGLDITTDPGAELDLFIAGNLDPGPASNLGSADQPASVRTYVAGDVTFQGSTEIGGNFYAPTADVALGASGGVYGSVFVNSLSLNANTQIHFDSAIRRAGDVCLPPTDGGVVDPPDPDAGTPPGGCNACFDPVCQGQACQINTTDPSGYPGTCGSCRNALDCCPNESCIGGTCIPG